MKTIITSTYQVDDSEFEEEEAAPIKTGIPFVKLSFPLSYATDNQSISYRQNESIIEASFPKEPSLILEAFEDGLSEIGTIERQTVKIEFSLTEAFLVADLLQQQLKAFRDYYRNPKEFNDK
jgi:hypothetical protein